MLAIAQKPYATNEFDIILKQDRSTTSSPTYSSNILKKESQGQEKKQTEVLNSIFHMFRLIFGDNIFICYIGEKKHVQSSNYTVQWLHW